MPAFLTPWSMRSSLPKLIGFSTQPSNLETSVRKRFQGMCIYERGRLTRSGYSSNLLSSSNEASKAMIGILVLLRLSVEATEGRRADSSAFC